MEAMCKNGRGRARVMRKPNQIRNTVGQIQIENALTQQSITHRLTHTHIRTQLMRLVEGLFSLFHFELVRISINSSLDLYCTVLSQPFPTCAFISMAPYRLLSFFNTQTYTLFISTLYALNYMHVVRVCVCFMYTHSYIRVIV